MKFGWKKIAFVFLVAFVLNFIWENWHVALYIHYRGGNITEVVLLRATLFDATFIALLYILFVKITFLCKRPWLMLIVGFASAIIIEWYALSTGRWSYNESMPIIPLIQTGLTPTIQLALTGYFTISLAERKRIV